MDQRQYQEYIKEVTPSHSLAKECLRAFLTGGAVCTLGQALTNLYLAWGADAESARTWMLISLIALSVILTGLNLFTKIASFGGAGALVPITGFANSVAAPAIEFQAEGQVFGIGCKIFTISGPVILYGVFASWILGLICWLGKTLGWL